MTGLSPVRYIREASLVVLFASLVTLIEGTLANAIFFLKSSPVPCAVHETSLSHPYLFLLWWLPALGRLVSPDLQSLTLFGRQESIVFGFAGLLLIAPRTRAAVAALLRERSRLAAGSFAIIFLALTFVLALAEGHACIREDRLHASPYKAGKAIP
jgi:hypothetical protein